MADNNAPKEPLTRDQVREALAAVRIIRLTSPPDEYNTSPIPVPGYFLIQATTPFLMAGEYARAHLLDDAANPLYYSNGVGSPTALEFALPFPNPNTTYIVHVGIYKTATGALVAADTRVVYTTAAPPPSYTQMG